MIIGIVKWFNNTKKYGFISTPEGKDIFVHFSEICVEGFKTLKKGQRVEFDVEESLKGTKAVRVKKLPPEKIPEKKIHQKPQNGYLNENEIKRSQLFFSSQKS